MTEVARIAMWSGPRTISTALMRAWENRADTVVVDEPRITCCRQWIVSGCGGSGTPS